MKPSTLSSPRELPQAFVTPTLTPLVTAINAALQNVQKGTGQAMFRN
jgi:hypothetical protein